jgi:dihydroorotase
MGDYLIAGGLVLTPDGPLPADVVVRDGMVTALGDNIDEPTARRLDASGCWVGPGFVDLHVHFREPGQTHKEDIATGSAAAVAGGYTAVVAMPNTTPAIDRVEVARFVEGRGREVGLLDVRAAGCLTIDRAGRELAPVESLWEAGVRVFSDDGDTVEDVSLMRRAMQILAPLDAVLSEHAIDPGLAQGGHIHDGAVAARLGIGGIPAEAEVRIVRRDIELVRETGARYHLQHASTAESIELIRAAKAEGLPVTVEATPHHLAFTEDDLDTLDTSFKMMPPLRTADDAAALRAALVDGAIDIVATDHAPHTPAEKSRPFPETPNGVIGSEWAAAVVNTVVPLDMASFFDRMSVAPARIGRIGGHGQLVSRGIPANLVIFDPDAEILPTTTQSRSRNAPYLGRAWRGRVRHTIYNGRLSYSANGAAL